MRKFLGFVALSFALTACSNGDGDDSSTTAPEAGAASQIGSASIVALDYRKSFDRAWERAGEGRNPTPACAGVFGRAVGLLKTSATDGQPRSDALTALDACYVRVMARFVDAKLAADNPVKTECINLLQVLPVHRKSLGSFFDDVGEDKAVYDKRLNELIGDKVRSACPDAAHVLLET